MEILSKEIKMTVEKPDKIMDCDICGYLFYIKKFANKGELLVMAEMVDKNHYDVKCFGWLKEIEEE